ncbi:DUF3616 domain-containing protein [Aestuariibius sp. HNIBRBA575]|uniref:DUF3616 domain-containing protein n=1 Tax=Aestuariibius sp. HNIBRBA575 TaxID=3233343 RepID=UPI0034A54C7A
MRTPIRSDQLKWRAFAFFGPVLLLVFAPQAQAETQRFNGLCDISAAASLGDGTLIAASDEENKLFTFSVQAGAPIAIFDLNNPLDLAFGSSEIDIEAAAIGADRIWWIGSHQAFKPNRQMVFATNIPAPSLHDLTIEVPPFNLTQALQSSEQLAEVLHPLTFVEDPKNGGLNIEAAALTPQGHLMIGLRSPLAGTDGVNGPAILIKLNLTPSVSVIDVALLDLSNRGLRGMTALDTGFLIIAGASTGVGHSELFHWIPGQTPIAVSGQNIANLNPETLVSLPNGLLVLSDDSSAIRHSHDGGFEKCKTLQRNENPDDTGAIFTQGLLLPR